MSITNRDGERIELPVSDRHAMTPTLRELESLSIENATTYPHSWQILAFGCLVLACHWSPADALKPFDAAPWTRVTAKALHTETMELTAADLWRPLRPYLDHKRHQVRQCRWKNLAMLSLRTYGWTMQHIALVFGHNKGHITRCIKAIRRQIAAKFNPEADILIPPDVGN